MLADAAGLAANWERWLHDGPLEILPTPASRVPLHRKSTLRERPNRTVGSGVIAERTTGVCEARERGVCDEAYTLPDEQGGRRPGWSFLFEQGRYDGFSPDEVEVILEVTGELCREVADDEFQSVMRLRSDFRRGRFAPAFPPEQRATVHEAAANSIPVETLP